MGAVSGPPLSTSHCMYGVFFPTWAKSGLNWIPRNGVGGAGVPGWDLVALAKVTAPASGCWEQQVKTQVDVWEAARRQQGCHCPNRSCGSCRWSINDHGLPRPLFYISSEYTECKSNLIQASQLRKQLSLMSWADLQVILALSLLISLWI